MKEKVAYPKSNSRTRQSLESNWPALSIPIQKCLKTQQEGSWGWRPLSCCLPPEAGVQFFTFRLLKGTVEHLFMSLFPCSHLHTLTPWEVKNKERRPSRLYLPSQCWAPVATAMRMGQTLVRWAGTWSQAPGARVRNTAPFAPRRTEGCCLPTSSLWTPSSGLWEVTLYGSESYGEGILLSSTHV